MPRRERFTPQTTDPPPLSTLASCPFPPPRPSHCPRYPFTCHSPPSRRALALGGPGRLWAALRASGRLWAALRGPRWEASSRLSCPTIISRRAEAVFTMQPGAQQNQGVGGDVGYLGPQHPCTGTQPTQELTKGDKIFGNSVYVIAIADYSPGNEFSNELGIET